MIRPSLVSAFTLVSSVAALAVFGQACSSSNSNNPFQDSPKTTSQFDASTGSGDDTTGDDGTDGGTVNRFGNDGAASVDSGLQSCATAQATASRQAVYMLFVLDGSGSMGQDSKWTAAPAPSGPSSAT